jgi:hypothetical protein
VFYFGTGKETFAECFFWHSAKKLLCREPFIGRSVKPSLPSAETLPSVFYLALGKAFFAERPKKNARQSLRRSVKKRIPVVKAPLYLNFLLNIYLKLFRNADQFAFFDIPPSAPLSARCLGGLVIRVVYFFTSHMTLSLHLLSKYTFKIQTIRDPP